MTERTEPGPKPDPELERLRALSHLPQAHLDNNFYHAVDHLRTAVEAMDITLQGIDLDRRMFLETGTDQEMRRRWAAHLVMVRNLFWDIERRVRDIDLDVRKILAID
jgi:hypothetical protein